MLTMRYSLNGHDVLKKRDRAFGRKLFGDVMVRVACGLYYHILLRLQVAGDKLLRPGKNEFGMVIRSTVTLLVLWVMTRRLIFGLILGSITNRFVLLIPTCSGSKERNGQLFQKGCSLSTVKKL